MSFLEGENAWGDAKPLQHDGDHSHNFFSPNPQSPHTHRPRQRGVRGATLEVASGPLGLDNQDPLRQPPSIGLKPSSIVNPASADTATPSGPLHHQGSSDSPSLHKNIGRLSLDSQGDTSDQFGSKDTTSASGTTQKVSQNISSKAPKASKASFRIVVGDPHKVGDMATSHTQYRVQTETTSTAFHNSEFEVARRFRDFLWLYEQLQNNNPGIIVPPPPEKKAINRFDSGFVESRRQSLEKMLNKIASHRVLQNDTDFRIFLESESFNVVTKQKGTKHPEISEPKGMMASIAFSVRSTPKYEEQNVVLVESKAELDTLEAQLKALDKALDTVIGYRKGLAKSCQAFGVSLDTLAKAELSSSLSNPLESLAQLQNRIEELYNRQAEQDDLTIGIVINEYIRLIGSIKNVYAQRQKAYISWHEAENELAKRQAAKDKLMKTSKTQTGVIEKAKNDVDHASRRVNEARLLFEDIGRLMMSELQRFKQEKVEDFKCGVETYLESAVETQKQLIEHWEMFRLALDAEEQGLSLGEVVPVGVVAPDADASSSARDNQGHDEASATSQSEAHGEGTWRNTLEHGDNQVSSSASNTAGGILSLGDAETATEAHSSRYG